MSSLDALLAAYRPDDPLEHASTIPSSWYTDPRLFALEQRTVFARAWQPVARVDQLRGAGDFVTAVLPDGEPVMVVRGGDGVLRAFFNVCRHHAAAVVTEPAGCARVLRCPYHGWTYGLDGALKGTPDFDGVCGFERSGQGLVPLEVDVWEGWACVRVEPGGPPLGEWLGADLVADVARRDLAQYHWVERRLYSLDCNWKVFVDNFLDGGYHVPFLHGSLDSVLRYTEYAITTGLRSCVQTSPLVADGGDEEARTLRAGERAYYYWIHPHFMINVYGGAMDTNLVIPRGVDRTDVIFDFFFSDVSPAAEAHNRASIAMSERIQDEDVGICAAVQRGLRSRAYTAGRLSVRREAGEHLFHRLLHADLAAGLGRGSHGGPAHLSANDQH